MRLCDFLDESVIKIELESIDKEECFEEMVDLLVRANKLSDRKEALRALHQREDEATTGIGRAFAVPHGKTTAVKSLTIAIGTSKEGIEFDSIDNKPVHLVLMIFAPPDDPTCHIQALAEVMRLVRIPGFPEKLASSDSPKALLDNLDAEE